jgi:hypothetical protein
MAGEDPGDDERERLLAQAQVMSWIGVVVLAAVVAVMCAVRGWSISTAATATGLLLTVVSAVRIGRMRAPRR